jgi:cbb3-type cytochrome oxidase subunit 3
MSNERKQLGEIMKAFITNLIVLVIIGVVLFVLFPDIMRGILGLYDGLGILPIFILLVIVSALPKRKRRRRN